MPIETLQDVVEYLADQVGIYGAHDDEACEKKPCRVCWTGDVTERIWKAVRIEEQLERGREIKGVGG
jgi:hypothetical protein